MYGQKATLTLVSSAMITKGTGNGKDSKNGKAMLEAASQLQPATGLQHQHFT